MYVSVLYSKKCKNLARGMIGVPKSLQGGCDGNLKDGSLPRVGGAQTFEDNSTEIKRLVQRFPFRTHGVRVLQPYYTIYWAFDTN